MNSVGVGGRGVALSRYNGFARWRVEAFASYNVRKTYQKKPLLKTSIRVLYAHGRLMTFFSIFSAKIKKRGYQ